MAQYPKIESTGSIRSIILAILEVQVYPIYFRMVLDFSGQSHGVHPTVRGPDEGRGDAVLGAAEPEVMRDPL